MALWRFALWFRPGAFNGICSSYSGDLGVVHVNSAFPRVIFAVSMADSFADPSWRSSATLAALGQDGMRS